MGHPPSFCSEGLYQSKKPAGMKPASYDRMKYDPQAIGRILSASRAVLKTHLGNYIIFLFRIQFLFCENFITEKTA
jgi:hypothetical protein